MEWASFEGKDLIGDRQHRSYPHRTHLNCGSRLVWGGVGVLQAPKGFHVVDFVERGLAGKSIGVPVGASDTPRILGIEDSR